MRLSTVAIISMTPSSFGVNQAICTGSLITDYHVLTAGHCLEGLSGKSRVYVIFADRVGGELSEAQVRRGILWRQHEGFAFEELKTLVSDSPYHDIGLILMDDAAPEAYEPMSLLPKNFELAKGHPLVLAGYGATGTGKADAYSSGRLRYTGSYLWENLPKQQEIAHGLSAGNTCNGDSGGPILVKIQGESGEEKMAQVGITSRGDENCKMLGVDTDVRYYFDWINGNLKPMIDEALQKYTQQD